MKTSFITTVLNEEKTIDALLDSLNKQSKLPDEIVISDAGSSDKTSVFILNHDINKKRKIFLVKKKGNRSIGRNEAIKKAKGDVIAISDAGCILDRDFIKNITSPFKDKSTDVVSGYYYPKTTSLFEKCLATYTCVMPDRINKDNFLPSSRSVAFKKSVWQEVGGYPENLETCEDLVFAKKIKDKGFKFKFAKNAYVYWPQRKNVFSAFNQFFNYSIGDGMALFIRPQVYLLFLRGLFLFLLLLIFLFTKSFYIFEFFVILFLAYILWSINKNYKYIKDTRAFIILPALQLESDFAVFLGTSIGVFRRFSQKI